MNRINICKYKQSEKLTHRLLTNELCAWPLQVLCLKMYLHNEDLTSPLNTFVLCSYGVVVCEMKYQLHN